MKKLPAALFLTLSLVSCSTTRSLSEGQYRLSENKVVFDGKTELKTSDVSPYIKQSPNTYVIFKWSPALNIYNWADPDSDSWLSRIWRKIGTAPVVFNGASMKGSVENIEDHLEYLGYYGSQVRAKVDTADRIAKVTYFVKPGRRYRIDSVAFHVQEGEFADEFAADSANISVRAGDYLSASALESESSRGATYFRNLGYYDFNTTNYFFEADTLGPRNILHYSIKGHSRNEPEENDAPLEKYHFNNVSIVRSENVPFRDKVLSRVNILYPGQVYSEKQVNTDYSRFSTLRVFNSVGIDLKPLEGNLLDCTINLRESKLQGVKFNLEASTNSSSLFGISPKISYYHKNIFHGGERLSVDFSGNFQFKPKSDVRSTEVTGAVGISLPRFLGLPYSVFKGPDIPGTEFLASYSYQDRPEYKRNVASFSYGYTGQAGDRFFYQFYPLQVNYVFLDQLSESFLITLSENPALLYAFYDHLNAGVGGTLMYTTNSDLVPKTPYRYVRFAFDLSGNVLSLFNNLMPLSIFDERLIFNSPYSQFVRGELTLGRTFRWGENDGQSLAARFLVGAGYAYGNSSEMPFEKEFFAGGASSMRGWQARALGPGYSEMDEDFVIPSQYGDFKMELDLEYRFKMFWKLEGALFAEAGNVWMYDEMEDFLPSIAGDWGLGIRLNLDFILIRVDGGFKVYDPSRPEGERWRGPGNWLKQDGFAVHLGVGYPF